MSFTKDDLDVFYGQAREDLIDFCIATDKNYDPQWFQEEIAKALEAVERGEIKRLIIEMPPRHGKSELCTIKFPAFALGKKPSREIITSSYADDLSRKFGGECRDLMNEPSYKAIFPDVSLREDTKAKNFWRVTYTKDKQIEQGGGYMAVGVGGPATGSGADIFIIDDPIKNKEEAYSETMREKVWDWYTHVARTRLEKDAAIIIIMTRWHEDDLVGRVLERSEIGGEPWTRITFKAIADEDEEHRKSGEALWSTKYSTEDLHNTRIEIGEQAWFALYQQTPRSIETQQFRPEWMKKTFTDKDIESKTLNRFVTIDVADADKEGADYTGTSVVDWDQDNNWYLQHIKRHRLNILGLIDHIFEIWINWKPMKIGVEKKAFEYQVKPLLKERSEQTGIYPVVVELEHGGRQKEARILGALQGRFENGKIYYKEHARDDSEALKAELFTFPKGKYDDLMDSLAYIEQIGARPFSPQKEIMSQTQRELLERRRAKNRSKFDSLKRM